MKAYKGFNLDMTDKNNGFQFREGETYTDRRKGFSACVRLRDLFFEYSPWKSVFHEVEIEEIMREKDNAVIGKTITIGAEIPVSALAEESIETFFENFEFDKKIKAKNALQVDAWGAGCASYETDGVVNADDHAAASAGQSGAVNVGWNGSANVGNNGAANASYFGAANAGDNGAAKAGDNGVARAGDNGAAQAGSRGAANAGRGGTASAGYMGAANAGDSGIASVSSNGAANVDEYGIAIAGEYGVANAGECGVANAGECGVAVTSRFGRASVGENGIAAETRGHSMLQGGLGACLVFKIIEDGVPVGAKMAYIDGETFKPGVWYWVENGEIVEVDAAHAHGSSEWYKLMYEKIKAGPRVFIHSKTDSSWNRTKSRSPYSAEYVDARREELYGLLAKANSADERELLLKAFQVSINP